MQFQRIASKVLGDYLHRIRARWRHGWRARNTRGNGIHSPRLFYIVTALLPDADAYYCFRDIERQRERLLRAERKLQVQDYGTGVSGERSIQTIAKHSLATRKEAQMLFRLVNDIHPITLVELGTSLGITTAYLAKAAGTSKVVTFEGSEQVLCVAQDVWKRLGIGNVESIVGNIDTNLPLWLKQQEKVDFAFIDANHTEEATCCYFDLLANHCGQYSVVVIDDIHFSSAMEKAWKRIQQDTRVTSTMDLYDMGIVFFNQQYMHKHYTLHV